jgi:exopolysaccharide production protein ExoZ
MAVISTLAEHRVPVVSPMPRRKKLFHLQALRGLAASLVVFAHSADILTQHGQIPESYAGRLAISGYFGVATFFIISGFIIYTTSTESFGDRRATAAFAIKRVIRIFPVYWLAIIIFLAVTSHRNEFGPIDILYSLLLIPHVIPAAGNMHPLVGQGWTLQYEMLFYLIFAVGLSLTRRTGTLLVVATLIALVCAGEAIMPLSDMTEPLTIAQYWTRPILLLFAVGMGLGVLEERLPRSFTIPRPFLLMLGVLCLWYAYTLGGPLTDSEMIQFPTVLFVWLLCTVWVFAALFGESKQGWTEWLAEQFGDASYSVYLFHTTIIAGLAHLKVQAISPVLFVVAALIASNAFGLAMYRLVERPILRTCRRLLLTSA